MVDGAKFYGAKACKDAPRARPSTVNMMTVLELHRRLHDSTGVTFNSMHPRCIASTSFFCKKRFRYVF